MARKTPPEFEITIDRIVFGGEGMGHFDNRPVFVFGVLPGETVRVQPLKVNRKFVKARLVAVVHPHPNRQPVVESHYLACSPWQPMPYDLQCEQKKEMVLQMWRSFGRLPQPEVEIIASDQTVNYRNKIEFSCVTTDDGKLSLAFHQRYRFSKFLELETCVLASDRINTTAAIVMKTLNEHKIASDLIKNILIRSSFSTDAAVVVLYVTDKSFPKLPSICSTSITGFVVVYSDPRSPAAIITKVLYSYGNETLQEMVDNKILSYHYQSFFQVNPLAFCKVVEYLKMVITPGGILLDAYAGVGTIGFVVSDLFSSVITLEYDQQASVLAAHNAGDCTVPVEVIHSATEQSQLAALCSRVQTVIVDPPRSGLHPDVIRQFEEHGPDQLVYVSCNPATQCRDTQLLTAYRARAWRLFDLYPNTPHVESVIVFERKRERQ